MREDKEGFPVSKEIARRSEIIMLEQNVDFIEAQKIVFRNQPKLLKQYEKEVLGE